MNNKEIHRQRLSLILLVSILIFVVICITVGLGILVIHILLRLNIIGTAEDISRGTLLFLIAMVSAIMGFLITFFTSKYTLKPVNQLINQLERLSNGDFKTRIKFGNPIAVHPTFRDIEKSFNKAAEELEQTDKLRNNFVNNFSHEFKTPIVSIAGFAKMLQVGNLSDEEKEKYLKVIEDESLRLSSMANNVLSLTRVENQGILTNVSKYNLSEQIRQAILMLTDMWTQKDLNLDINFAEYTITANKELLEQAWINLLNNAMKFSDNGGTVSVDIQENDDCISVAISNGGKIIPKESIDRIFNKFYQADESHSSEGNGIGLAVVKKVVDLHNGKITVECENGKTTFTVVLPK